MPGRGIRQVPLGRGALLPAALPHHKPAPLGDAKRGQLSGGRTHVDECGRCVRRTGPVPACPLTGTHGPMIRGLAYGFPSPGAQDSWNPRALRSGRSKRPSSNVRSAPAQAALAAEPRRGARTRECLRASSTTRTSGSPGRHWLAVTSAPGSRRIASAAAVHEERTEAALARVGTN